ncbi:MAG TPA: hypothetical protein PLA61_07735 [Ferruginibacter sp.]|nr:hypothetical protein [Ferruginibacter sp.]HNJ28962.1 hypothetical protein [Ferruginibacter sp.]HQR00716.1 hypothetical protein [Ferruginibacter sp.]
MYTIAMTASFEAEKNRKALIYTVIICGTLLLLAFLISWTHTHTQPLITEDLIEINLGNNAEGYGEVQPLVKGEKAPGEQEAEQPKTAAVKTPEAEEVKTDDLADKESATIKNPVKTTVKVKEPTPVAPKPEPKPQKPKIAGYSGPKNGTGNGATEDNGYKYQGNNPGGKGDAGNPNGKPDSYGNNPGGRTGGSALRVSKGDRTIVNNYIFMGDLPKATINAVIKVSPSGRGTFVTFDKGSTSADPKYANAIRSYLPNIEFNKSDHESIVTVPFNFREQ